MIPTVAIVGRPNVGKSTLFNRLTGVRKAIVDDISGVTRDRIYGISDWGGREFNIIDTGGFVSHSEDQFEAAIREQVQIALDESDVVIFLVDVTTGITDLDQSMADILRRRQKPVMLVVNKVDNYNRQLEAAEFYSLGFDQVFNLSAITGSGSGELLDAIIQAFPPPADVDGMEGELPKFAIIGQPNVGKSSLLNALLGTKRNIVTDIAGTTRDSINTHYNYYNKEFILIDTAGIRKKAKVHENLEFYSVIRAIKAMDESDVCLLMIDAQSGIESQDMKIFQLAQQKRKGIVILVNKWDLVNKETNTANNFEKGIIERISPFSDVPVIFISAVEKQRIFQAIEAAIQVYENRKRRISTSRLNEFLEKTTTKYPPPSHRGKYIRIKYVTQLPTRTPTFAFFCSHPKYLKDSYAQYMENRLREEFEFSGVPVKLLFKQK